MSNDESLADAARSLLSPDAWTPIGTLTAHLGERVPGDKALATYARLARAGGRKADDRGARVRIGRERFVQEVMQHLVGRGKAEGCGSGDTRQYRLRATPPMSFIKRPKPRREWVPLDRAVFDPRLQFRVFPDGRTYDEATVEAYREARSNGAEFPPLEAVEETVGKKTTLWIFGGFHRGEMYRRDNMASVEVLIFPGCFADARLYALRENSNHGRTRTADECRKAFDTLLDDADLLARVLATVKDSGGVQRSLAAACGISNGAVGRYLADRGLQADRKTGKLVPIPKPAVVESMPAATRAPLPPEPSPAPKPSPPPAATVKAVEQTTSADRDPENAGAKDAIANLQKDIRAVGRNIESLLRSRHGNALRAAAKARGLAFATAEREESQGINDPGRTVHIEYWPVLSDLQAVFADVSAQVYAG